MIAGKTFCVAERTARSCALVWRSRVSLRRMQLMQYLPQLYDLLLHLALHAAIPSIMLRPHVFTLWHGTTYADTEVDYVVWHRIHRVTYISL